MLMFDVLAQVVKSTNCLSLQVVIVPVSNTGALLPDINTPL